MIQKTRLGLALFVLFALTSLNCSLGQSLIDRIRSDRNIVDEIKDTPVLKLESVASITPTSIQSGTPTSVSQVSRSDAPTPTLTSVPVGTPTPLDISVSTPVSHTVVVFTDTPTPASASASPPTVTPFTVPSAMVQNTPTSAPTVTDYNPEKGFLLPAAYSEYCEDDMSTLNADWYYQNWFVTPASGCPTNDRRFVPRIFNAQTSTAENIAAAIDNARASGWLMGFGEPNISWNGNTTPEDGAWAWRRIEEAALPAGIKLVAPGPSQHDPGFFGDDVNPYGYTWIWKMVDEYEALYGQKPHFDAMAWNYYGSDPQAAKNFITARHQEALDYGYDIPIWILEYAGNCWDTGKYPTGNEQIMTEVTSWFNSTPWIARYAWFTNRIRSVEPWDGGNDNSSCSLLDPDTGELTELGKLYAAY